MSESLGVMMMEQPDPDAPNFARMSVAANEAFPWEISMYTLDKSKTCALLCGANTLTVTNERLVKTFGNYCAHETESDLCQNLVRSEYAKDQRNFVDKLLLALFPYALWIALLAADLLDGHEFLVLGIAAGFSTPMLLWFLWRLCYSDYEARFFFSKVASCKPIEFSARMSMPEAATSLCKLEAAVRCAQVGQPMPVLTNGEVWPSNILPHEQVRFKTEVSGGEVVVTSHRLILTIGACLCCCPVCSCCDRRFVCDRLESVTRIDCGSYQLVNNGTFKGKICIFLGLVLLIVATSQDNDNKTIEIIFSIILVVVGLLLIFLRFHGMAVFNEAVRDEPTVMRMGHGDLGRIEAAVRYYVNASKRGSLSGTALPRGKSAPDYSTHLL